jgi:hypothetical protein
LIEARTDVRAAAAKAKRHVHRRRQHPRPLRAGLPREPEHGSATNDRAPDRLRRRRPVLFGTRHQSFNADDIGISTPAPVVGRAPASPEGFVEQIRRGGHFEGFNDGKWVDNADKARELADPSSKVTQAMLAGKYRFMDDKIIDAALGTAYSGKSLATSNSLPAAQVIAVDDRQNLHDAETVAASGNLGLTIGKIITARYMLEAAELEGRAVLRLRFADEKAQLLASTPATRLTTAWSRPW